MKSSEKWAQIPHLWAVRSRNWGLVFNCISQVIFLTDWLSPPMTVGGVGVHVPIAKRSNYAFKRARFSLSVS